MPTSGQANSRRRQALVGSMARHAHPTGATVVQDPAQVPDVGGSNAGEDAVDGSPVVAEERGKSLGAGLQGAGADEGEAPHIRRARLQAGAPVGLEDRIAVGAVGIDGVLVGIDDGQAGGTGEPFRNDCERIIGQQIAGLEDADAVVGESMPPAISVQSGRGPMMATRSSPRGGLAAIGKVGRRAIARDHVKRPFRIGLCLQRGDRRRHTARIGRAQQKTKPRRHVPVGMHAIEAVGIERTNQSCAPRAIVLQRGRG